MAMPQDSPPPSTWEKTKLPVTPVNTAAATLQITYRAKGPMTIKNFGTGIFPFATIIMNARPQIISAFVCQMVPYANGTSADCVKYAAILSAEAPANKAALTFISAMQQME